MLSNEPYVLGLLLADAHIWTGSVGLTTTSENLAKKIIKFLLKYFPPERIKVSLIIPENRIEEKTKIISDLERKLGIKILSTTIGKKHRKVAIKVYVNSRSLYKEFMKYKKEPENLLKIGWNESQLFEYFLGRIHGDGHIERKGNKLKIRICYSNYKEAKVDLILLRRLNIKGGIHFYSTSHEFVLYYMV